MTDRGWWALTFSGVDKWNDSDREHIAQMIIEGFTSGEIIHELRCEDSSLPNEDILADFKAEEIDGGCHARLSADFDNGQWFVNCLDCGAAWSVNDAEVNGEECFSYEQVSTGDEFCFHQGGKTT